MTASQPASLLALAERLADTQIPFLFLTAYDESFGRNGWPSTAQISACLSASLQ